MTDCKTNHSGFSLVEVLLVVVILSIAVTFASVSISLIYSRDAEKCAKSINSALETTRMSSLAQEGEFYLEIDANNHVMTLESSKNGDISEEKLPNRVGLSVTAEGSTTISGNKVKIEFDKATGKVKNVTIDEVQLNASDYNTINISAETVSSGKKASVMLIKMTGKHYLLYGE